MTLNGFFHAHLSFIPRESSEHLHFMQLLWKREDILLMLVIEKLKFRCLFVEILTHVQCCGSGMLIPDPGSWFYPSRISDHGSGIQKQKWKTGVKKNFLSYLFFGAIKFTKLNYFIFEMLKKKIWPIFKSTELFTQKYVFGIRDPEKNYSGFSNLHPLVQRQCHWNISTVTFFVKIRT